MLSGNCFNIQEMNLLEVEIFIARLRKWLVCTGLFIGMLFVQFDSISQAQGDIAALAALYGLRIEKYYQSSGVKGCKYLSTVLDLVLLWAVLYLLVDFQYGYLGLFFINAVFLAMRFGISGWHWLSVNLLLFILALYYGGNLTAFGLEILWLFLVSALGAWLAQQHRQIDTRLLALYRLSGLFNSTLRVNEVMEIAIKEMGVMWPQINCYIAKLNCQGDFIILGSTQNALQGKLELGSVISAKLVEHHETVFIKNTLLDKRLANDFLKKFYLRSVLLAPIIVQGKTTGLVILESQKIRDFNHDEMAIVMLAASQIGISMENARLYERMENLARLDELTQVYNRRAFHDVAAREFDLVRYKKGQLSLIMIDIDHFKKVNDCFGHQVGDHVLARVAEIMKQNVREGDSVARYGGEEFVLTLPSSNKQAAYDVAERIRLAVENLVWNGSLRVTISAGVASYPADGQDLEELLKNADQALYGAKSGGRNRVQGIQHLTCVNQS